MAFHLPFTLVEHSTSSPLLSLVFGTDFLIVDTSNGAVLATTRPLQKSEDVSNPILQLNITVGVNGNHKDVIRTVAFSKGGNLLASSGEDKILKVWDLEKMEGVSSRSVAKRVNALTFSKTDSHIITADKFGDAYSFPLNPAEGKETLLLGHVSLVIDMTISLDNQFIITSDRDEHIRVSHFPNGYNIKSYCLGHTDIVTNVKILPWAPNLLISGGGDNTLRLWEYLKGEELHLLDVYELIKEFIVKIEQPDAEFEEKPGSVMVTKIRANPITREVAVSFEKTNALLILFHDETSNHLLYKSTLSTTGPIILDFDFDQKGNIWASTTVERNSALIKVFLSKEDGKYEILPDNHSLVKQINQHDSIMVERLPELFPYSQLRKTIYEDQEGAEDDESRMTGEDEGGKMKRQRTK